MKPSKFIFLALMSVSLVACDYIDGPKVDPNGFPQGSGNKVLVEDFTGHQCGSCPGAHVTAKNLLATYGDNLVVVAVHASYFAQVDTADGYLNDFMTPMGTELDEYYSAIGEGYPTGLVNRRLWNGKALCRPGAWSANIATILAEDPRMEIDLVTTYDEGSRTVDITADLEYYTAGDANHRIVAILTEDSITSRQADYSLPSPSYIDGYQQMHVLRTSITPGTWGIPVKGNAIFAGEKISHDFTLTLDPAWRAEQCEVVVYVMDNTTKEVWQVEKARLSE